MLPKSHRLTTNTFQRVFQKSKRFRGENLLFLYAPARGIPRYGVSVGKKKIASAVGRNRMRRVLYAQFREHLMPLELPFHVICLYNPGSDRQDVQDFKKDFAACAAFLKKIAKSTS